MALEFARTRPTRDLPMLTASEPLPLANLRVAIFEIANGRFDG